MHIHINHCWCSDSNWGGNFDCRYVVDISKIAKGKLFDEEFLNDWNNLIKTTRDYFDKKEYEMLKTSSFFKDQEESHLKLMSMKFVNRIDPKALKWLEDTIKDDKEGKGWCVGSDSYNATQMSYSVFFKRKSDALLFVKTWSEHKKPLSYFDYFNDIRKELNLKTNKLEVVQSFD